MPDPWLARDVSTPASIASPAPASAQVLSGGKKLLARLAGLIVRAWGFSLRVTLSDASFRLLAGSSEAALFVLWHNRLFVAAELCRRFRPGRPTHSLISASKDGAWLATFFESMGLRAVRGSSSRGGREAAAELVRVLREGHDAGITPDGPRGPLYVCKPGALVVARRAGVRVLVVGVAYESAWRLRSWDRFLLPRPFSQVRLTLRELPPAALEGDAALVRLESALRELNPGE